MCVFAHKSAAIAMAKRNTQSLLNVILLYTNLQKKNDWKWCWAHRENGEKFQSKMHH